MTSTPDPTAHHTRDAASGSAVLDLARGMAMGTADIIPGVSGGTVALILGVYPRLIGAIRSMASAVTSLGRGRPGAALQEWQAIPWRFVLALGGGIVIAIAAGSAILPPLLEGHPVETSALFFGMIVASLAVPWRDAGDRGVKMVAIAAVAAVAAFAVMGLPAANVVGDPPTWRIAASAAIAICAMILPGVSGAFLLLALGVYEPTLSAIRALDLAYIGTFALGAVVGLGLFSKVLGYLLERRAEVTMAALTGLMLGALRVLWPWGGTEGRLDAPTDGTDAVLALGVAVVGFAIVRALMMVGDRAGRPGDLGEVAEEVAVIEEEQALADDPQADATPPSAGRS
jgi:putative membrane protein